MKLSVIVYEPSRHRLDQLNRCERHAPATVVVVVVVVVVVADYRMPTPGAR